MRLPILFALLASASAAHAGEKVLYAPAADWVLPAPPIAPAMLADSAPALIVFDSQTRLKDGVTYSYFDSAQRAVSAQVLAQMGNVALPWMPDRGDLTIHRAEIVRGAEHIDLLRGGQAVTVLRREEQMEQRMLTGMLTATLAAEGLRVGDVLRISFTVTQADPALKGNPIAIAPIMAAPARAGFGRARLIWPSGDKVRWKGYAEGLGAVEKDAGGAHEVSIALPLAKQPEMPDDLPQRYARLPIVEASGFADWNAVSRALAPLYATDGLIAPGSALAGEVATIAAAEKDPLRRAQRALQLVQDKVRYLALAMNGGGLTPQTPDRTWATRYGDCKAKTLLLLAILHDLGIEAEAVAASAQTGGLVFERLPGAAAFDHVLVRATVNGESLWLDGTKLGDRLEDIRDTPAFRYVLPLRAAGAGLMPVPIRASARPDRIVDIRYDQSAGFGMPATFDGTITLRGGYAQMLDAMASQTTEEQKGELVRGIFQSEVGEAQFARQTIRYDPATATATITAAGVLTTPWRRENGRYRLTVDRAIDVIGFAPDRTRAAWRALPVAAGGVDSVVYRSTVALPAGIAGYVLEGDQKLPATIAGRQVTRNVALSNDRLTLEDRIDSVGAEIAASDLPAERARYAQAQARRLRVIAPETVPNRAAVILAGRRDGRFKPIEAIFAGAIANDPEEPTGYSSRAAFRYGIADWKGAIADYTKLVALVPDADSFLLRGNTYFATDQRDAAMKDFREAYRLDPANDGAIGALAGALDAGGDSKAALALLDERIALGDDNRYWAIRAKGEVLALNGDPAGAVALLDAAIAGKPGDPAMLNGRCWTKGIGNHAVESALKDCTKAIELDDSPVAALDSRAMAYFRLGRFEDALADLDAALDLSPQMAASLYLRGVVRTRLKRDGAADDLAAARLMYPAIDRRYARYGIAP